MKKVAIILIIVAVIITLKLTGSFEYLTFDNLLAARDSLASYVDQNLFKSVIVFVSIYLISVAFSVPGATILTLAGGFLFGYSGVLLVNIGATGGASTAFLLSRYLLGDFLQKKYATKLDKFNKEINENGINYLLTMRFLPIFPFFLINIMAGLTRVSVLKFVWTTSLGIIPGSFVYIYAGRQLSKIDNLKDIMSIEILLAFIFLGLLSLIPVVIKKLGETKKRA